MDAVSFIIIIASRKQIVKTSGEYIKRVNLLLPIQIYIIHGCKILCNVKDYYGFYELMLLLCSQIYCLSG